jgi:uncharacterized membrane protein HdeD (DUF308 family)
MANPVVDDLKRLYHRTWWALMLRALLALVVGIFILLRPLDSVAAFALVIAFWALFSGMVDIVHAIELAKVLTHWWVLLVSGLIGVGFGVFALIYYPVVSLAFAVLWAALWLLIIGLLAIYAAFRQKKLGVQWGWTLAAGVLGVVASAFALLVPPITLAAIMGLIAAFAIVSGVALIVGAFRLRSLVHA